MKRIHVLLLILALVVLAVPFRRRIVAVIKGHKTIEQRIEQYGEAARGRLAPAFAQARVAYPPARLTLLGFKEEKQLQLYAADADDKYRFIRSYRILAASGELGPKLREGDRQVPEGIYRIESLNPNSAYHLSLRVNYPNEFDRTMGERDRRAQLGSDIMIHGSDCSIGCLAMGDAASEDLFVLAHDTGLTNIRVILSPVDFRTRALPKQRQQPEWIEELYGQIRKELHALPTPRPSAK